MSGVAGLLLAAGSGRRYGTPKALVDTGDGPWVLRALRVLTGCDWRQVVVGARAAEVVALLAPGVTPVHNPDHATGMASSLRAGLLAVPAPADAVLITLVDLPDVTAAVAARVLAAGGATTAERRAALARAVFDGRPGHPVLIGREHLPGVLESLTEPDSGAGPYLRANGALRVECGDLAGGADRDAPLP